MIEFQPGDIVLVRGHRSRYRLSRLVLRLQWNHVLLYYKYGRLLELTSHGIQQPLLSAYLDKSIVVLRLLSTGDETTDRSRTEGLTKAMWKFRRGAKFDWFKYVLEWLQFSVSVSWARDRIFKKRLLLCDEFVQITYESVDEFIDLRDIMRHDYTNEELREKYGLTKIYDYRCLDVD